MHKMKSILTTVLFSVVLFGIMTWGLLTPDAPLSKPERRLLKQKPHLSAETFFSGEYSDDLEGYLLDQFPLRDDFRAMKSQITFKLLRKCDNNDYYMVGSSIAKLEYRLNEIGIGLTIKKINALLSKYLSDSHVYYSVIPDKNYFIAAPNGYPSLDYDRMLALLRLGLAERIEYIDIFPELDINSYYRTDLHWRQEQILNVAETLAYAMDADILSSETYTQNILHEFRGAFLGQSALPVYPDNLIFLTSSATACASAYSAELESEISLYSPEKVDGIDGYDVFLSGAQAIVTINSPNASSDKHLVIFRDSFGSALAPLFTGVYSKITLIDLRYVSPDALEAYVNFQNADVLFLYGVSLINNGGLLK